MDNIDDTPASPVPDHEWDNTGAETPDHVSDGESHNQNGEQETGAKTSEHATVNEQEQNDQGQNEKEAAVEPEERSRSSNAGSVADEGQKNSSDSDEPVKLKRKAARIEDSSDEDEKHQAEGDEEPSPKKRKAHAQIVDSSDEDEQKQKSDGEEETGEKNEEANKLIDDIFGEESGDEQGEGATKKPDSSDDDEQPIKSKRKADYSDDEEDDRPKHRWDFDEIMAKKKMERRKNRKRRNDGGIDLISDNDDQIKTLVDQMMRAAALDRTANENRQPAFQKHKLLSVVRQTLLKTDLFEVLLDNQMMSAVSDWLAPLPDKSLPSLEIRTTLLKILSDFPNLEQGVLRQSGLGKAVMYLLKHPREIKENKQMAARLIREWSRPIFQLDSDYSAMTRDERIELDNAVQKRRRSTQEEPSSSRSLQRQNSGDEVVNPGQAGFVSRARVPKPSTRAYINRPKSSVDAQFGGATKAKGSSRFDVAQRDFKERTKRQKAARYASVSVAGNKMEI